MLWVGDTPGQADFDVSLGKDLVSKIRTWNVTDPQHSELNN